MDVDGNDNSPEWGYCTYPGCREAALPIWLSGGYPSDPDLLRCDRHIGSLINALVILLKASRIYVDRMTIQVGPCPHNEIWQCRNLLKRIDTTISEAEGAPIAHQLGYTVVSVGETTMCKCNACGTLSIGPYCTGCGRDNAWQRR